MSQLSWSLMRIWSSDLKYVKLVYASYSPPNVRKTQIFEAAPQDARGVPAKKPAPDYFL